MIAAHKNESPAATGQFVEKTHSGIISDDKAFCNLRARFAIAGFAVHRMADDGYLVCRWNLSKHCPDVRTLAAFAKQVGAV